MSVDVKDKLVTVEGLGAIFGKDVNGDDIETTYVKKADAVSGVKGNEENSYRTGDVNLTPANIGAKATQSSVSDPTASGTSLTFIDSISQNAQGVITPTKKTVASVTQSTAGLMSSTDKTKLDGIETGAQANSITGIKGNEESDYRTGNVNITPANVGAKSIQSAVSDPTASGTSLTFIDSISQNAQGVIMPTKKTVSTMGAASSNSAGTAGLVPAPASGDNIKYLRGDGTWADVNGVVNGVKGAAETGEYRTGNVELTAANIGAVNKAGDTMTGGLTVSMAKGLEDHFVAKATGYTDDKTLNCELTIGSGKTSHGIYSNGYSTDGNSFTAGGKWMIYRDNAGAVIVNGKSTDNVLKSGDTMTGNLEVKYSSIDASKTNNNVSSTTYPTSFCILDTANRILARNEAVIKSDGNIGSYWYVRNYNTSGAQVSQKGIQMHMDKSGNLTYAISDPENFISAIGAVNKAGDTMTGTLVSLGELKIKKTGITMGTTANNGVSSDIWTGFQIQDNANATVGIFGAGLGANGNNQVYMQAYNKKTDGTSVSGALALYANKNGSITYAVTSPENFRSAIGAPQTTHYTSINLDTLKSTGLYSTWSVSGTGTSAFNSLFGEVINISEIPWGTGTRVNQIFLSFFSNEIWQRKLSDNTWSSWKQLMNSNGAVPISAGGTGQTEVSTPFSGISNIVASTESGWSITAASCKQWGKVAMVSLTIKRTGTAVSSGDKYICALKSGLCPALDAPLVAPNTDLNSGSVKTSGGVHIVVSGTWAQNAEKNVYATYILA